MKLIGPDGTQVILAQDLGGSGDNYTNTIFDDQASASITTGTPPFTGTFKPQGVLANFNGKNVSGNWTLHITDDSNSDGGNLLSWAIELCSPTNIVLSTSQTNVESENISIHTVEKNKFKVVMKDKNFSKTVNMDLYNSAGQEVLRKRLNKNPVGYETEFDMSYAPKGIYIVKISDGTETYSKKLIVN